MSKYDADEAFARSILLNQCKKSPWLDKMAIPKDTTSETLRTYLNTHHRYTLKEFPIIVAKALTLMASKWATSEFPILDHFIKPDNLRVSMTDDERSCLLLNDNILNSDAVKKNPNIVLVILRNIILDLVGDNVTSLVELVQEKSRKFNASDVSSGSSSSSNSKDDDLIDMVNVEINSTSSTVRPPPATITMDITELNNEEDDEQFDMVNTTQPQNIPLPPPQLSPILQKTSEPTPNQQIIIADVEPMSIDEEPPLQQQQIIDNHNNIEISECEIITNTVPDNEVNIHEIITTTTNNIITENEKTNQIMDDDVNDAEVSAITSLISSPKITETLMSKTKNFLELINNDNLDLNRNVVEKTAAEKPTSQHELLINDVDTDNTDNRPKSAFSVYSAANLNDDVSQAGSLNSNNSNYSHQDDEENDDDDEEYDDDDRIINGDEYKYDYSDEFL